MSKGVIQNHGMEFFQLGVHLITPITGQDMVVTYAVERPRFDGCANKLRRGYCPCKRGCFSHKWNELNDQE